jgi:nucleotide-binding universal stress UspA family protein
MPFTRILCPIDLSPISGSLLECALAFATGPHAHVHVLHAVEPLLFQAATIAGEEAALRAEIREAIQRFVREAGQRTSDATDVATSIAEGAPETVILEMAERESCDLVVMGMHGMSNFSKACFGSTLDRVLRAVTVPVLALPHRGVAAIDAGGRHAFAHMVAAIDFEQPSMEAARLAATLAQERGIDLTLLHVMPTAPLRGRWQDAVAEQHALRRERAANELSVLASELRRNGPPVQVAIREGAAWERIAAFGGGQASTLVVMGLRNPGRPLARPGSTAWRVLSAGAHPVLAVPAAARRRRLIDRQSFATAGAYTEAGAADGRVLQNTRG